MKDTIGGAGEREDKGVITVSTKLACCGITPKRLFIIFVSETGFRRLVSTRLITTFFALGITTFFARIDTFFARIDALISPTSWWNRAISSGIVLIGSFLSPPLWYSSISFSPCLLKCSSFSFSYCFNSWSSFSSMARLSSSPWLE